MAFTIILTSPLFTEWTEQYVRLYLADIAPGTPLDLIINGHSATFQYTGNTCDRGAEILVKLGFAVGEKKQLVFTESAEPSTDFARTPIPFAKSACIGTPISELRIPHLILHPSSFILLFPAPLPVLQMPPCGVRFTAIPLSKALT